VTEARLECFRELVRDGDPDSHEAFYRQHDPGRPAHSVWMKRDDARTVSLTRLDLSPVQADMTYLSPGHPAATTTLGLKKIL
jgi:hypothetical protein